MASKKTRESFLQSKPALQQRALNYLSKTVERQGEEIEAGAWIERVAGVPDVQIEKRGQQTYLLDEKIGKFEADYFKHCRKVGVPKRTTRTVVQGLNCLCGCGKPTKNDKAMFIPSHDMKLKSKILKVYKEVEPASIIPDIAIPLLPTMGLGLERDVMNEVYKKATS